MASDDEPKTLTFMSPQSSKVIVDLVPESHEGPPFEVVVDRMKIAPSAGDDALAYRMLELTTERRVYIIDASFTCIEVIDRKSRQSDPAHPCQGARLIGGQRRSGSTVHQVKPFPIVGTAAIFEKTLQAGQPKAVQVTSKLVRVVLKVRVSSVIVDASPA